MQQFIVTGMSCAACSARVEKAVSKVEGVTSCSVSLLTNSMGVEGTAADQDIIQAVEAAGYGASVKGESSAYSGVSSMAAEEEMLKDHDTPVLKRRLLDGASDTDAVYYLVDITGDGSPELIVGTEMMNVYSCNQGAVTTIGSMTINTAYLSQQYGFLAFIKKDDQYELVQYKYNGEMITENILVSAVSESDYRDQASRYLSDAREMKAYALDDRTPFGDEAAE